MKKSLVFLLFSLIAKINAQNVWELINPLPTYQDTEDIHFISESFGYILTENQMLMTDDAGENWNVKMNIDSANDMGFHNEIGYVVGDNGYILRSVDSGSNWEVVGLEISDDLENVYIIDPNNIIITSSTKIYRTLDGGETWVNTEFPDSFVVFKSYFIDNSIGFVINDTPEGSIWKTTDGGANWYLVYESGLFLNYQADIYFVNNNVGFAYVPDDEFFWMKRILKTVDGGESWEIVFQNVEDMLKGFSFINENIGFLLTGSSYYYKTTNSGDSWEKIYLELSSNNVNHIHFINETTGYTTGRHGRIYKTNDGGTNWLGNSVTYNMGSEGWNFQFVSDSVGYFNYLDEKYDPISQDYKNHSRFFKYNSNTDLIEEIIVQTPEDFSNDRYTACSFSSEIFYCHGFFRNKIYKSLDEGHNWGITNYNLGTTFDIQAMSAEVVYVSSLMDGSLKLTKSIDGGENWDVVLMPENNIYKKSKFHSVNLGYILCSNQDNSLYKLYKTTDGGITWQLIKELPFISGFISPEPDILYFVSDDFEYKYVTKDDGQTWSDFFMPNEFEVQNDLIKLYDDGLGFIVIDDQYVYKTTDYATTWEYFPELDIPVFHQSNLNTIIFNKGHLYFYNFYNPFFKTELKNLRVVDHSQLESDFYIYPNPISEILNIKSKENEKIHSLKVLDNLGNVVFKQMLFNQSEYSFDVSSLQKGIYYLIINSRESKKILKK